MMFLPSGAFGSFNIPSDLDSTKRNYVSGWLDLSDTFAPRLGHEYRLMRLPRSDQDDPQRVRVVESALRHYRAMHGNG